MMNMMNVIHMVSMEPTDSGHDLRDIMAIEWQWLTSKVTLKNKHQKTPLPYDNGIGANVSHGSGGSVSLRKDISITKVLGGFFDGGYSLSVVFNHHNHRKHIL